MKHLLLLTMVLIATTTATAADADIPRTIDADGPAEGVRPMSLRELWRVGGEDEDLIFGRITDVKRHPDGSVYVLDNQLCQVVVISEDGEHLRNISRQGDGPGELRQPMGLVFLSDEVLGVGMGFPAKFVTLGVDGTPIGTHYPCGEPAEGNVAVMISLHFNDGVLMASGGSIVFSPNNDSHTRRFLTVGDASCTDFHHICEKNTPFDPNGTVFVEADNYYIDRSWVLGPGGRIYAPMARDAYEISEFDTNGDVVRVFGRKYRPRERSQFEKDQVGPVINSGVPADREWSVEDHDQCITRIMVDPDDETVWVLTPHGHQEQPDDILETWDVYSPSGEYLRQVPIPLGGEMNEGTCFLVGGHRLVVMRGTDGSTVTEESDGEIETEPLEIICYEILPGEAVASLEGR